MSRTVVVGAGAGIGKYIAERFGAIAFVRGDVLSKLEGVETVIFCAAKARFETAASDLYTSLEDNLFLLERISRLPHQRFVYFSTVDLYPNDDGVHCETEDIKIEALQGGYPAFKLMGEAIVQARCKRPLILRPTSLFGKGMRPNNIVRLITEDTKGLSLAKDANFNCITYEMVTDLIEAAIHEDETGIINCAATGQITLGEVAALCGYEGAFGQYSYSVRRVANERACKLVPSFKRSSADIVGDLIKKWRK